MASGAQNPVANDDNLQPGATYTFSFTSCNLTSWLFNVSPGTVLSDLSANSPSFIGSVSAAWASQLLAEDVLNITFTYTGDGSDVASDVANEIIAAVQAGSSDCLSFVQATSGTSGVASLSDVQTATSTVSTTIGTAAGNITGGAAQGLASGLTSNLGASGWVLLLVVVLGVIAYFSATTGVRLPRD
jgi:hypothetical protein